MEAFNNSKDQDEEEEVYNFSKAEAIKLAPLIGLNAPTLIGIFIFL